MVPLSSLVRSSANFDVQLPANRVALGGAPEFLLVGSQRELQDDLSGTVVEGGTVAVNGVQDQIKFFSPVWQNLYYDTSHLFSRVFNLFFFQTVEW